MWLLVGALSHTLKGGGFDSCSGCIQEVASVSLFLLSKINQHILRGGLTTTKYCGFFLEGVFFSPNLLQYTRLSPPLVIWSTNVWPKSWK